MDVRLFPNTYRPGVGVKPRREGSRPLLPQHSRHCPVLEAGSAMGFMVYPALEQNESFSIEFQGEGRYQFTYLLSGPTGAWQPVFAIAMAFPVGSIGVIKEEVTFIVRNTGLTPEGAKRIARAFVVPEDMGTPPGAVALRGAYNFRTPEGWDTVYTPVFNNIERPMAPMLIVRVETDWYPHDTEFRYVLMPGESISGTRDLPIGQVLFVPREDVTMRDCTERELEQIFAEKQAFFTEKAAARVKTPYGLYYSPHYLRQSREKKS